MNKSYINVRSSICL